MHKSTGFITTLAALLCLSAVALPAQPSNPREVPEPDSVVVRGDLGRRIDDYMTRLSRFGLSGSLLVARDGAVVLQKGYGVADRSTGAPVRVGMLFNIGSLTKQFTAAAILKLQMMGKLRVTDTLGRFFPDAPADKAGITLHQLLTHSAGLPYLWNADMFAPMTGEQIERHILAMQLISAPGEKYSYSNPGYSLLARVIERASGRSYADFLRTELFEPAGMRHTAFEGDPDRWNGGLAVHSYSDDHDEGALSAFPISRIAVGAGTAVTTVNDLYRWELALEGDAVLSKEARAALFTPYVNAQGALKYAYAWNVGRTPRATTTIFHAGDIGGYNAEMRRYPDEGMTVIFTSNARVNGVGYRTALVNNLVYLITGAPYQDPPAVVDADPIALGKCAGTFRFPSRGMLTVRDSADRLTLAAFDQTTLRLLAGAPDSVAAAEREYTARAVKIAEGMARNNYEPLRAWLHPSVSFEGTDTEMRAAWRAFADRFGAFRRVDALGTAVLSAQAARSYLRLQFKRGAALMMLGWDNDGVAMIDDNVRLPMATAFLPISDTAFVHFDPFTGRSINIAFERPVDGIPSALTFGTPNGRVTAARSRM